MKQFNNSKGSSQGNTKTSQGNSRTSQGNSKTSQGKTWKGKTSQGSTYQGKTSQGNTYQGKTSQVKIVQGKPEKGKTAQGKTLTDWDSYITKEAGITKSSSGNNNEKHRGKSNGKNNANNNGKNTLTSKGKVFGVNKTVKENKATSKVIAVKRPIMMHLFYVATEEYACKQIVAPIVEEKGTEVQLWPELGIASIEFDESGSIDFQECEIESFDSESDLEFIKEHGIKVIYEVTMDEANKAKAANCFLSMIQDNGGFFCTDSDDFAPIYNKEELEKWK